MALRVHNVDRPRRWLLIALAAATAHALALVLVPLRDAPLPAYAGATATTLLPGVVAGLVLVAAGSLALILRTRAWLGTLALLASVCWWAPTWVGWEGGLPLVRSIGMVIAPLLIAVALHMVVAVRPRSGRRARVIVGAIYVLLAATSVGRALVRDPFLVLDCGSNCVDNVFLVWPDRALAASLDTMLQVSGLVGAIALIAYAAVRLSVATAADRRASAAVLISGLLVGAAEGAYGLALLATSLESATDPLFVTVFLARAAAITLLALSICLIIARSRLTTARVTDLARNLAAATGPGGLRQELARALGDPGLQVAYWLPLPARYVDEFGAPLDVRSIPAERMATPITRGRDTVAMVIHQTGVDPSDLIPAIGPAARLASENERLRAEVRAQIAELRDARRRIVSTGDERRSQLERNLHDGAQQRLLAVSYELRLAESAAKRDRDLTTATAARLAADETLAALDELRDLAHGIFPAILAEAGLSAAIQTLSDDAPMPLNASIDLQDRCPPATEMAAYVVIDDVVREAARRGATQVTVEVGGRDQKLHVLIEVDVAIPTEEVVHLADRVGASGGELETSSTLSGHVIRAELPCA